MNHKSRITLSLLVVFSVGTAHAGVRKTTRSTLKKGGSLAVTQVRGVVKGAARVTDAVVYPLACLLLGGYVYDTHLKSDRIPNTPDLVQQLEDTVPGGWGTWTHDNLLRLLVGCLTVTAGHAVVNTDLVGDFVDENMPRLSRLVTHVCTENGLSKKKSKATRAAL